jgi:hypothetical protein
MSLPDMKIEITFNEEDNEFALVNLDGRVFEVTESGISSMRDNMPAYFIADVLSEAVRKIMHIRALQAGYFQTWEPVNDESTLECMEDAAM